MDRRRRRYCRIIICPPRTAGAGAGADGRELSDWVVQPPAIVHALERTAHHPVPQDGLSAVTYYGRRISGYCTI